jgi:hypothetical protein
VIGDHPSKNEAGSFQEQQPSRIGCILLAILPLVSFLGQLTFSCKSGTQHIMYHHLTVMVVDWVFVPFNLVVIRAIEWRRGGRLFLIMCISVALNLLTEAFWQYNGSDLGHMITKAEVVLPAGWIHLGFSIIETMLLMGFVFCRKTGATGIGIVTMCATIYFLAMGICGYIMHNGFIASDVITFVCGLFFVLVYPQMIRAGSRKSSG